MLSALPDQCHLTLSPNPRGHFGAERLGLSCPCYKRSAINKTTRCLKPFHQQTPITTPPTSGRLVLHQLTRQSRDLQLPNPTNDHFTTRPFSGACSGYLKPLFTSANRKHVLYTWIASRMSCLKLASCFTELLTLQLYYRSHYQNQYFGDTIQKLILIMTSVIKLKC